MADPIERIIKTLRIIEKQSAFIEQEDITVQILNKIDSKFHDHVVASEMGNDTITGNNNRDRIKEAGWEIVENCIITSKGAVNIKWLSSKNRKEIKKLLKNNVDDFSVI